MKGQITVFLSLILTITLSLVSTVVEAARVNVAKSYIERTLVTGMDSVLADYYLPLYDNYKIFLLDTTYEQSADESIMVEKLRDYTDYSFHLPKYYMNLFEVDTTEIEVTDTTSILDYSNEIFTSQVVDYMKYKAPMNILEGFLDNFDLINKSKATSEILDKKTKADKQLEDIDMKLMNLATLIDGITYGKKGVSFFGEGKLKTEEYFVKKIYNSNVTKEGISINNELIYSSLKDKYINSKNILNNIQSNISTAAHAQTNITSLKEQLISIQESISSLSSIVTKDKKEQEAISNQLSSLYDEAQRINEAITNYQSIYNRARDEIESQGKMLDKSVQKIYNCIIKTNSLLVEIEGSRDKAKGILDEYSRNLFSNKDNILPSVYESLNDELQNNEAYTNGDSLGRIKNLNGMKETLNNNKKVLEEYMAQGNIVTLLNVHINEENKESLINIVENYKNNLEMYLVKDLTIDYSGLFIGEKLDDPRDNISSISKLGLMNMLIDDENTISKKTINKIGLPSQIIVNESDDTDDIDLDNPDKSMYGIEAFNYENNTDDSLIKKLLVNEYIVKQFKRAEIKEKIKENADENKDENQEEDTTVLDYENEYIIAGKDTDYKNLESVLKKIVAIRFIFNLIHILSDKSKQMKAEVTAMSILSFAGILGRIAGYLIKFLIISAWSFAESLIDAKALLMDKKIPFIKTKEDWNLNYEELFTFNKNTIKQKAESIKYTTGFSYVDYIRLLLFLSKEETKNLRTLDLMQLNINYRRDREFDLSKCIYGFKAKITYKIKPYFIGLKDEYIHTLEREYTY